MSSRTPLICLLDSAHKLPQRMAPRITQTNPKVASPKVLMYLVMKPHWTILMTIHKKTVADGLDYS